MARGQLSMKNGVAQHQQKKQKIGFDCETAVAESQPSPSDDNEEQPVAAAAATAVAAAARSLDGEGDMPGRNGWWPAIQNVAEYE